MQSGLCVASIWGERTDSLQSQKGGGKSAAIAFARIVGQPDRTLTKQGKIETPAMAKRGAKDLDHFFTEIHADTLQ